MIVWIGGQPQGTQGQLLEDREEVVPDCPSIIDDEALLQRLSVWMEGKIAAEVSRWRSQEALYSGGSRGHTALCIEGAHFRCRTLLCYQPKSTHSWALYAADIWAASVHVCYSHWPCHIQEQMHASTSVCSEASEMCGAV